MEFVEKELQIHPAYIKQEVEWEYNIYSDLGFSRQEYQDLVKWKNSLHPGEINLKKAFDRFTDYIIDENENEKKGVQSNKILDALSGSVGMAIDLLFFHDAQHIPELVSSSTMGLSAIAKEFKAVRKAFFKN